MKVSLKDKEIQQYVLSIEIEVENKQYQADIKYSNYDGYEITFLNEHGQEIEYPKWAVDYESKNVEGFSLSYWLEEQIGGWFEWAGEKVEA